MTARNRLRWLLLVGAAAGSFALCCVPVVGRWLG